jgi:hypothetical protein
LYDKVPSLIKKVLYAQKRKKIAFQTLYMHNNIKISFSNTVASNNGCCNTFNISIYIYFFYFFIF